MPVLGKRYCLLYTSKAIPTADAVLLKNNRRPCVYIDAFLRTSRETESTAGTAAGDKIAFLPGLGAAKREACACDWQFREVEPLAGSLV